MHNGKCDVCYLNSDMNEATEFSSAQLLIEDRHDTILQSQQTRPISTSRSYLPKQEEFKEWCRTMRFIDGDTVTADKLNR